MTEERVLKGSSSPLSELKRRRTKKKRYFPPPMLRLSQKDFRLEGSCRPDSSATSADQNCLYIPKFWLQNVPLDKCPDLRSTSMNFFCQKCTGTVVSSTRRYSSRGGHQFLCRSWRTGDGQDSLQFTQHELWATPTFKCLLFKLVGCPSPSATSCALASLEIHTLFKYLYLWFNVLQNSSHQHRQLQAVDGMPPEDRLPDKWKLLTKEKLKWIVSELFFDNNKVSDAAASKLWWDPISTQYQSLMSCIDSVFGCHVGNGM